MSDTIRGSFQDDKLAVTLVERHGALWLELTDRVAQRTWAATPLLQLEIHDKRVRREERVEKCRIEALAVSDTSAHVTISAATYGVTLGIWLALANGELAVRFSTAEVHESDPVLFRLFAVDVLPSMMRVTGAAGRLLLPVNGATLCHPVNKPVAADRFMIYLEQPRWELATMLPIAAAWDERSGLMALATKSAAEAQCRVATDGQGAGQVGFAFVLRQHWVDPVEPAEREFRFTPIPPRTDAVPFVAKRLRRHVLEDLGKPTLKQRAAESPAMAYQLRAMTVKLFHGIQNNGACITDTQGLPPTHFINAMTFDEAAACLKKLRSLGIPRLYTQSVGWNPRGHDGLWPTRFPVEERLGGEERFRELFRTATALGYQANVHDNYRCNYPSSPDWNTDHVIQDVYGEPLVQGWWASGVEYGTWPAALPEEKVAGNLRRIKALGVQGMGYCDYWFSPLEVNYHPRWPGTRAAHQRGIEQVLRAVRGMFGAVGTEFGSLPAAVACDSIAVAQPTGYDLASKSSHPEWPVAALLDEMAPVWPLALHGLTLCQAGSGADWALAMSAIVWGSTPRDEWGVRPVKMSGVAVFDDHRAASLQAIHDLCIERFGHLQAEEMTRCALTSDRQEIKTAFADGTEVHADFTAKELIVNGQRIEKPAALLS